MDIEERLKVFMENEMRSCSMDIGGITPLYVFRSWGGKVPLNEIETALKFFDERSGRAERQDPRFMFQ